ncbi:caspase family protein [Bacteroidota bacterium]|nr:caspase family protein [Bacteroidota bacterium]
MKKLILLLFIPLVSVSLYSQDEKRLALVIGNSNYDKGELKNPVNDARLIASTLDSLDFDVILKENISTKREMLSAIKEFGIKRSEYDIAFVYYAGHGIQIENENFLLPTKEVFEEEFDVMDYGVSVQNIMRYLKAETNKVNILILDACRDNPFESNWNTTRSLKGSGLAKIPPPTGSLIAFSTDSGQTAPDGDEKNSFYTISLSKNMLLKDTSIDQMFRNIRAEVLAKTGGLQRPVEATQLTGNTYYLLPNMFEEEFLLIDEILISNENLNKALETTNIILSKSPELYSALQKKANVLTLMNKPKEAADIYRSLIKKNPFDIKNKISYIIHDDYSVSELGFYSNILAKTKITLTQDYINDLKISSTYDLNPWVLRKLMGFLGDLSVVQMNNLIYYDGVKINDTEGNLIYPDSVILLSEKQINDEIDFWFKAMFTRNLNINPVDFFHTIVTSYRAANYYVADNYDEGIPFLKKFFENNNENFKPFYIKYVMYYAGPMFREYVNTQESISLLNKYISQNKSLYAKFDGGIELYQSYEAIGKYEEGKEILLDLFKITQNASMSLPVKKRYVELVFLYLSRYYFIIENDFINSLSVFDKITSYNEAEGGYFISDNYVAYSYYSKYLINIILKRYPEAKKSFYDFVNFCENKGISIELTDVYKLSKAQFAEGFIFEQIEISENPVNEGGLIFEEELVLNLYTLEEDIDSAFYLKNYAFKVLLNSSVNNFIKDYSKNFEISEKTIRSMIMQIKGIML